MGCPFERWVTDPSEHNHKAFLGALRNGRIPGSLHHHIASLGVEFLEKVGSFFENRQNFCKSSLSMMGAISVSMISARYCAGESIRKII